MTISTKAGFKTLFWQLSNWELGKVRTFTRALAAVSPRRVAPPQHSLCNPFPQLTAGGVRVGSENDQAALGVVHGARFLASALPTLRQWIPGYPRCTEPFLQVRGVGAHITSFEIQNKTHLWKHNCRMRRCTCAVDWWTVCQSSWTHHVLLCDTNDVWLVVLW